MKDEKKITDGWLNYAISGYLTHLIFKDKPLSLWMIPIFWIISKLITISVLIIVIYIIFNFESLIKWLK